MRKTLSLLLCFTLTGCATELMRPPYRAGALNALDAAAHPGWVEKAGVAVAVKVLDAKEAKEAIGLSLSGIQPALVSVRNGSSTVYRFEKGAVSPAPLPARAVYQKVRSRPGLTASGLSVYVPHPWGKSEEEIGWNLMFVLAMPLMLPSLVMGDLSEAAWNSGVKEDLRKKELADGPIAPGKTRSGLIYLPCEEGGPGSIRLELFSEDGSERLVFQFSRE